MNPPVDSETQEWIEARTSWILSEFGIERIRECSVLLPDSDLFANYRGTSDSEVKALVDDLCRFLQIETSKIDLHFFNQTNEKFQTEVPLGLYESVDGRYQISIEETLLLTPSVLVAVIVHELCHILLLGHGRLTGDEYDHEPLTDLLTLFLGCGVFTSNAVVYHENIREGRSEGWRIGRRGYLTMPMYGYAWALFAALRSEDGTAWKNHLRLDVRDAFNKSVRFLKSECLPDLFNVKQTQARPLLTRESREQTDDSPLEDSPAEGYSRTCLYCDEPIPKWAQYGTCKECRISIKQNEKELEEERQVDSVGSKLQLIFNVVLLVLMGLLILSAVIEVIF